MSGPASPHPPRLELERFATDDLPAAIGEAVGGHVATCSPCGAYVAELRAMREERLARVPPATFLDRHRQRRTGWRRRVVLGWTGALVAAAAGLALLAGLPRRADDVRLKGTGMTVYRKRGDEVRLLAATDRIRSGDALRVVVALPHPGRVWVAALDASGRIDPLVAGGVITLAGGEQPLPESAVVESPCADMWLIAWPDASPAEAMTILRRSLPSLRAGPAALPAPVVVRAVRCE